MFYRLLRIDALSKGGKRSIQQTATRRAYENKEHAYGILSGKVAKLDPQGCRDSK